MVCRDEIGKNVVRFSTWLRTMFVVMQTKVSKCNRLTGFIVARQLLANEWEIKILPLL